MSQVNNQTDPLAPALGKQCARMVHHSDGSFTGYNELCKIPAKYHEDGQDWCKRDTPSLAEARYAARDAASHAKWEARRADTRRQAAEHAALAGIANPAAVAEVVKKVRDLLAADHPQGLEACPKCLPELRQALAALDKKEGA